MKIYLMRHSETDWNRQGRIQGQTDIPLNMNGLRLAGLSGRGMAEIPFDICYVSPLVRAIETAAVVLSRNPHFLSKGMGQIVEPRIKEIGFGVWEGLHSRADFGEIPRSDFEAFYYSPDENCYCPEGAERLASVIRRSNAFIDEIAEEPALQDKTILAVTHGCTLRCIMSRFSADPEYFLHPHVPYNCEAAIVEKDEDGKLVLKDPGSIYYDSDLAVNYYGY